MILCLRSLTTIACTQYQWGLGGYLCSCWADQSSKTKNWRPESLAPCSLGPHCVIAPQLQRDSFPYLKNTPHFNK